MDKKMIIRKIESRKKDLKKIGVKKIGLFGSYVRGEQKKKSDVDLIVSMKDNTFNSYASLYVLMEQLLKKKIDLVVEKNLREELKYIKKEVEYAKI